MKTPSNNRFFLLVLFALNVVLFLPYFIKPELLTSLDNDLGRTYMRQFAFIGQSLKYLQVPLWNPEQMMGESFIGNPLSTLVYPLNLIFMLLPTKIGAIFYIFFHFLLASISTFFLSKTFKLQNSAAFSAAIFYAFSTKMLVHTEAGHVTMIAAFAYFPLLFLSLRKILQKSSFNYIVLGALSLTMMFITYTTIFYYAFIFSAIYVGYRTSLDFLEKRSIKPKDFFIKISPFVVLMLFTFGLSAIALLPQLEFGSYSSRSQLKFEDVAIPIWNLKLFLSALLFPYIKLTQINHEAFLYFGAVPTALALFGFMHLKRIQQMIILAFGVVSVLFILGQSTPFFKIAYSTMPLLEFTRVTTRMWFILSLVTAILAAVGISKIKNQKLVYLAIIIFLAESLFIFHKRVKAIEPLSFDNVALYEFLSSDKEPSRVYCTTSCFNPQLLTRYKIETLSGESPIANLSFVNFLQSAGNYTYQNFAVIYPPYQIWQVDKPPAPNSQALGKANVKYVASTYPLVDDKFQLVHKFDDVYLYENADFQKRLRFENSKREVQISKSTPNIVKIDLEESEKTDSLIISQNFYPGWHAQIDGSKYNLERSESVFTKVSIPANTNEVELKFTPSTLLAGKTITIGTVFFIVMYFLYTRKRKSSN